MKTAIDIQHLSKTYALNTHERYVALRDVLTNVITHPLQLFKKKESFYAIKDISMVVQPGEVVGIIGRNGAGKSTLLKVLSGITAPTSGEVIMQGTVASLLEVGTGFHPELTGRENIYFSGVLLGMSRHEVARQFDTIVSFAGVERFVDTPVKHYSSGMFVRLGFSVAAFLSADILFVDEVLAVGDAEFQERCIRRMNDVTKEGRTVLFVSHDLESVRAVADRVVYMDKGEIVQSGDPNKTVLQYLVDIHALQPSKTPSSVSDTKSVHVSSVSFIQNGTYVQGSISADKPFTITYTYSVTHAITAVPCIIFYHKGMMLHVSTAADTTGTLSLIQPGTYTVSATFPAHFLSSGFYRLYINVQRPNMEVYGGIDDVHMYVSGGSSGREKLFSGKVYAPVGTLVEYHVEKNNTKK